MLNAILILVAFQFLGGVVADLTTLPVPGMIIGLVLLLAAFSIRSRVLGAERAVPHDLSRIAKGLHDHFGLLFVPAGVGVIVSADRLAADGAALLAAVAFSTVTTIAVTALIFARRPAARTESTAVAVP